MRVRILRRVTVVAASSICLATAGVGLSLGQANATPAPNQALSGDGPAMYQTNRTARALAVSNGVVYAGGSFSSVRPPGAALGTNQTTRSNIAGFSTTTGVPTSFAPTLNGGVYSLAISANGAMLYAGGAFTTVNGQSRNHYAAFDLPAGPWTPSGSPARQVVSAMRLRYTDRPSTSAARSARWTVSPTGTLPLSTRRPVPC